MGWLKVGADGHWRIQRKEDALRSTHRDRHGATQVRGSCKEITTILMRTMYIKLTEYYIGAP
jgi:hypothetical protein